MITYSKFANSITAAVVISLIGMAFHTVWEFGWGGLFDFGTGMLLMLVIEGGMALAWRFMPQQRRIMAGALLVVSLLQLIGGAILSVLPLGFLPFVPEQSLSHYFTHLIYGAAQLPLIWLCIQYLQLPKTADQ